MTTAEAESHAMEVIHHCIEEERPIIMELVIVDVLTSTPCYYASNPRELERHIRDNWDAILEESELEWSEK
jgi:chaperone required for assembly of F1-ATPase